MLSVPLIYQWRLVTVEPGLALLDQTFVFSSRAGVQFGNGKIYSHALASGRQLQETSWQLSYHSRKWVSCATSSVRLVLACASRPRRPSRLMTYTWQKFDMQCDVSDETVGCVRLVLVCWHSAPASTNYVIETKLSQPSDAIGTWWNIITSWLTHVWAGFRFGNFFHVSGCCLRNMPDYAKLYQKVLVMSVIISWVRKGSYRNTTEHVNIIHTCLNRLPLWEPFYFMFLDVVWCCYSNWRKQKGAKEYRRPSKQLWGGGGMLPVVPCFDSSWTPGPEL